MSSKRLLRSHRCVNIVQLVILTIFFIFYSVSGSDSYSSPISVEQIRGRCKVRCAQQMNLDDDLDIACNASCKIAQCNTGCDLWENRPIGCFDECQSLSRSSSKSSSLEALSSSDVSIDHSSVLSLAESQANLIYCAMGCNYAPTVYVDEVRKLIGNPPAPKASLGSITKDSLILEWPKELVKSMPVLKQRVQYKYANISSAWSYLVGPEVYQEDSLSKVKVSKLASYTAYIYRIEWQIIPWLPVSIWSSPSEPIRTLEYGVPTTACSITSALAISSSQISIAWLPPSFANGPIIAYGIYLNDLQTGEKLAKDLTMHSQNSQTLNQQSTNGFMNYVFNGLKASRRYRISIVTFNNFGEGPACEREIETLSIKNESEIDENYSHDQDNQDEKNSFFLASKTEVGQRDSTDFIVDNVIYYLRDYISNADISGMAYHSRRRLLFVADSSGTIRRVSLKKSSRQVEKIISGTHLIPMHLSMDWLNDKLYYTEENRILRCDLGGENLESIVTGFKQRPVDMKVDPYNGYLFWLLPESGTNAVLLYRVDLAKLVPNANRRLIYTNGQIIYQAVGLSTFTINYFDYRIYFPQTSKDGTTGICSVTIDGKDPDMIREKNDESNIQDEFVNIQNLIVKDKRIFFTRGNSVSWEEYHETEDKYYKIDLDTENELVTMLSGNRAQSQPIPIPLNPVRNVEAIFLDRSAQIYWIPPELFGGAGEGAWQYWDYEVSIKEVHPENEPQEIVAPVSNRTNCLGEDLKPDTEYAIRVRALSSAGSGAWSDVFVGKTLSTLNNDWNQPYALVVSRDGLIKTNIVGKFLHELITRQKLNKLRITDITSLGDHIVLNTDSRGLLYNQHNNTLIELGNIERASSIAVEPFAMKIYWSNPNERLICRSNIDGTQMERLPMMVYANEIALDSINGILYWSTLHTIEYSRLNGQSQTRKELFRAQFDIHSLTIDSAESFIYWIVINSDGASVLMRSSLIKIGTENLPPQEIKTLPESHLRGPISRFKNRLYWLNTEKQEILISDDKIKTFATLRNLKQVSAFKLIDQQQERFELQFMQKKQIQVAPRPVDYEKIKITGTWDNFTLSWPPVTNVNYGDLFYELVVESSATSTRSTLNGTITSVHYTSGNGYLKPYSPIKVALRPFTYWSSAKQVIAHLFTPASTPSSPRDIRVFPYLQKNGSIVVEARWKQPEVTNGPIQNYSISLATVEHSQTSSSISYMVNGSSLSYRFFNLVPNETYFFEIRASTDAGEGPPSEVKQFKTISDASPPTLLVGSQDSIRLADVDLDGNNSQQISIALRPFLLDYHFSSRIVYWIEEGNFLKCSKIIPENQNFDHVGLLNEHATGLTIDWIGRRLFIATTENSNSKIWTQSIDLPDMLPQLLIELNDSMIEMNTLRVNPFSSELYWLERSNSKRKLQSCRLSAYAERCDSQHQLFASKFGSKCNCSLTAQIGSVLALDFSTLKDSKIIFFDTVASHFVSTDTSGCRCQRLASIPAYHEPTNLAFDDGWLFWQSLTHNMSVFKTKSVPSKIEKILDIPIGTLASFTQRNQPFPFDINSHCLLPNGVQNSQIKLLSHSASSLTLIIDVPEPGNDVDQTFSGYCTPSVQKASLIYTIKYRKSNGENRFEEKKSNNRTVIIDGLESFTNYTFLVEFENFYSLSSLSSTEHEQFSTPNFVFTTGESRPSPPRNVRAIVESPEKILVLWNAPEKINSNTVSYEVRWSSSETMQKSILPSSNNRTLRSGSYFMILEGVKPAKTYNITVRVLAVDQFTDSETITVRSFDEPPALRVVNVDSNSVNLSWNSPQTGVIARHQLFMQSEHSSAHNWTAIVGNSTSPYSKYEFNIRDLTPNTRYRFQLSLTYNATKTVYAWPRKYLIVTTEPSVPGTPNLHPISRLNEHDGPRIFKVSWDPVSSNSPNPIVYYSLYERPFNHDSDFAKLEHGEYFQYNNWTLVYNGTENYWIISGLESGMQHLFRLSAQNDVGMSNLSTVSMPFYLPFQDEISTSETSESTLVMIIGICVVSIVFLVFIALISLRRYQNKEKSLSETGSINYPMELRPWQQLPSHPHLLNTLYINSAAENFDLEDIKILDCQSVRKGKLLGKGAFGEVFEGWLTKSDVRVAIKVLNKEESDRVGDFLKEARLMSRLVHPNILQMFGVCFSQTQQPWLIMEFMEGGDLLNFLRNSRPNKNIAFSKLTMNDMLGICIDIAEGCKYLQRKCSVHRDLAARNCLVTTVSDGNELRRVVKIADFGLARGLYGQEYHRKNHIKLPVRWMAPESVVDGIFTSQSDVWSFGIVMYEVMVLGEQPYAGMSNDEVINYIRLGGILSQPTGCPFEIYNLMQRCWAFDKEARPSFDMLLCELSEIRNVYLHLKHQQIERNGNRCSQLTTVHNQNYNNIQTTPIQQHYVPHLESFSIANNMFAPYQNSSFTPAGYHPISHVPDDNYLFPTTSSRLTSATIVLDSSTGGDTSTSPSTTSSRSSSTHVDRSLYLNTIPYSNTPIVRSQAIYDKQESCVDY